MDELKAIVDHAKSLGLSETEHATLSAAVETLGFVTSELESKDVSIERLRSMLFGAKTETSEAVLKRAPRYKTVPLKQSIGREGSKQEKGPWSQCRRYLHRRHDRQCVPRHAKSRRRLPKRQSLSNQAASCPR